MRCSRKAALLLLTLAVCLMAGCQHQVQVSEMLPGTWHATIENSQEQALVLLENMELYPEEISLAKDVPLTYVQVTEFTSDGSYRFYVDAESSEECAARYYRAVFEALYEGRHTLNECYGQDFVPMTREEFERFYARIYVVNDFDTLIRQLSAKIYAASTPDATCETGTYIVKGDCILCTVSGASHEEAVAYRLEGEHLTLHFSNRTESYTRSK